MTEIDLKNLKDAPVPPPRPEARRAAIEAAARKFNDAGNVVEIGAQDISFSTRQTQTSIENRRASMSARMSFKIAASLAVIAIGVPLAYVATQGRKELRGYELLGGYTDAETDLKKRSFGGDQVSGDQGPAQQQLAQRREVDTITRAHQPALGDRDQERQRKMRTTVLPSEPSRLGVVADQQGNVERQSVPGLAFNVPAAAPPSPAKQIGRIAGLDEGKSRLAPADRAPLAKLEDGRDKFEATPPNPVKSVTQEPVSTFSIDVDTASYAFARRALNQGRLPPKDAVRVEEMINYFPYDYARPETADVPFRPTVTVLPSPWKPGNQLIHIAIKGYDLKSAERPRANLVFLVDISGSMSPADRLPLLKTAFHMLLDNLKPEDTVAIVTYASGSDVRLAPTRVAEKHRIAAAIDSLNAGGSTAGAAGIADAYKVAEASFDKAAVNRVILATDGDWNVGITNRRELQSFIERKRETGIYLSILGVGMGNHNDALMQTLAQNGNGVAAYIDTLGEARKVLVEEASSTLFPIAKDVKIQIEFNPARVSEYRLIGYETRMLRREDFNNDKVDAGDIGSGHSVTAIYEVTPVGAPRLVEDLRYKAPTAKQAAAAAPAAPAPAERTERSVVVGADSELGFLKIRYKLPKEEASRLLSFAIPAESAHRVIAQVPGEVRFSVAVAAFGQLLRGLPYLGGFGYDDVIALANGAKGEDPFGYRAEFVSLVRLAKSTRP